jgi:hypothetical protein
MLMQSIKASIRRYPSLYKRARMVRGLMRGEQLILLDYPVRPRPRYGHGKPPHSELYRLIDAGRGAYRDRLQSFLSFKEWLVTLPVENGGSAEEPCWNNGWLQGLDAVALYSLLCLNNPANYIEVGSGYSTKFARKAIRDRNLRTRIISIDPHPRAEIDAICDDVIRRPLEDVDLAFLAGLGSGDILFVDGSHRCLTNSDVSVFFLEILPRLTDGVFVHFHDIFLPYDYPSEWAERYYSEQYLLAVHLLAEGSRSNIVLPNFFVSLDPDLSGVLSSLWDHPTMHRFGTHGTSFWIRTT